jgi:hypothetical protein
MTEHKHETTDLDTRWVLYFGIGLVIAGVVIQAVVWWMYRTFEESTSSVREKPSLVDVGPSRPPEPRLQIVPEVDYATQLQREMEVLSKYEWVDRQSGIARIPIERAMEILAQRGRQ